MKITKDGTTVEGKTLKNLVITANDVTVKDSTVVGQYVAQGLNIRFENVEFRHDYGVVESTDEAEPTKAAASDSKKSRKSDKD